MRYDIPLKRKLEGVNFSVSLPVTTGKLDNKPKIKEMGIILPKIVELDFSDVFATIGHEEMLHGGD